MEGRLAQLVEHLVYTERVSGSSPLPPTMVSHDIAFEPQMEWGESLRLSVAWPISCLKWKSQGHKERVESALRRLGS